MIQSQQQGRPGVEQRHRSNPTKTWAWWWASQIVDDLINGNQRNALKRAFVVLSLLDYV